MPSALVHEMKHLSPDEILFAAMGRADTDSSSAHIASCTTCRDRVDALRESIGVMHLTAVAGNSEDHVSDDVIASLADGDAGTVRREEIAHVAECEACRSRLALLARTLEDDSVKSELRPLEPRLSLNRSSRIPLRFVVGFAAAAAIVVIGPLRDRNAPPVHREAAITATAAPRIISPAELTSPADSLRWTPLAQADLYRVRIWDSEGTVVWSAETRDTAIAIPAEIRPNVQYMWELDARTGWDRWVSSDLVALTLRSR
jgi:hypothetical protein